MVDPSQYTCLVELVKRRRSIHRFKPDPIPDVYIEKIIDVARWAPSGMNLQPWEFVVVKEPELKDEIVKLVEADYAVSRQMEQARNPVYESSQKDIYVASDKYDYKQAPVFILVFGDTRTIPGLPLVVQYTEQRARYTFQAGLDYALLYMHLAATTLGLASRWISAVQSPLAACKIKELLGITEFLEILDMVVVGLPALEPRRKLMRDKKKMVHHGRCRKEDFRTDEEVKDYIRKARTWSAATHRREADLG
jgi:5,6-dimethylbenzimidazole synthase